MLTEYIRAAMKRAKYEILEDDGTYYGEIPECRGVWANAATLEACREELQEVLEEWMLFHLNDGLSRPVLDGIDLSLPRSSHAPVRTD